MQISRHSLWRFNNDSSSRANIRSNIWQKLFLLTTNKYHTPLFHLLFIRKKRTLLRAERCNAHWPERHWWLIVSNLICNIMAFWGFTEARWKRISTFSNIDLMVFSLELLKPLSRFLRSECHDNRSTLALTSTALGMNRRSYTSSTFYLYLSDSNGLMLGTLN